MKKVTNFFYIADLEQIKKFNKKRNNYKIK